MKIYSIIPLINKFIANGFGIILEDLACSICSDELKQKWQLTKEIIPSFLHLNKSESEPLFLLVMNSNQIMASHLLYSVVCSQNNEVLQMNSSYICQVPPASCPSPSRCQSSQLPVAKQGIEAWIWRSWWWTFKFLVQTQPRLFPPFSLLDTFSLLGLGYLH